MPDDIVRDFMRLLRQADPQRPDQELWRLEMQLRAVWGGQRVYVCKAQTQGKVRLLAESLATGTGLDEARQALGIAPWTCYRLLRRRWVPDF